MISMYVDIHWGVFPNSSFPQLAALPSSAILLTWMRGRVGGRYGICQASKVEPLRHCPVFSIPDLCGISPSTSPRKPHAALHRRGAPALFTAPSRATTREPPATPRSRPRDRASTDGTLPAGSHPLHRTRHPSRRSKKKGASRQLSAPSHTAHRTTMIHSVVHAVIKPLHQHHTPSSVSKFVRWQRGTAEG